MAIGFDGGVRLIFVPTKNRDLAVGRRFGRLCLPDYLGWFPSLSMGTSRRMASYIYCRTDDLEIVKRIILLPWCSRTVAAHDYHDKMAQRCLSASELFYERMNDYKKACHEDPKRMVPSADSHVCVVGVG